MLVTASDGQRQIPLGELARVKVATGPAMIRNEDGLLTGYVFVDVAGRDISSYVEEASRVVREQVKLPPGYAVLWSGQYEAMARVRARLAYIIPLTLLLVLVLLYLSTRSLVKTAIVSLAVPFSAVGAIWYLYLLDYNMSIAVWVGLIALLGVDAQTGVFMLLYLDLAYEKASREGRLRTLADLQATIVEGAAKRLRPKFMTMATTFFGLIPIMWATGTGSDVWKRIAAPMVGGIFTSFVLELVVYPAIYEMWKWHFELKRGRAEPQPARSPPCRRPRRRRDSDRHPLKPVDSLAPMSGLRNQFVFRRFPCLPRFHTYRGSSPALPKESNPAVIARPTVEQHKLRVGPRPFFASVATGCALSKCRLQGFAAHHTNSKKLRQFEVA